MKVANQCYPILRDWGLYFDQENGYINRFLVIGGFAHFLKDTSLSRFVPFGEVRLGGILFDHNGSKNGFGVVTSRVKHIRRENTYPSFTKPEYRHDLLSVEAELESGGTAKLNMFSDEFNNCMGRLLTEFNHTRNLTGVGGIIKQER